jgi:peptide/nickel transport system substrate-binding protein
VRQALCYGVDVKSIVDNVLLGYGEMLEGQLPGKDCFGYNPNVKAYPYDPEKARALLAEAGYPDGFELDCKNPQEGKYLKSKECWEAAASQLAKIGVKCNIETVEIAMVDKMVTDGTYGPAFFFGWQVMPAMDLHLPLTYCRGDHTFKMIQDETFDRMLDEEAATLDQDERKKKLQEIVEYLHDFVTAIYLFELPGIWGVRPNVRGYDPYPNYRRDFTEISIV